MKLPVNRLCTCIVLRLVHLGITSVWPFERGPMSRNENLSCDKLHSNTIEKFGHVR